MGLLIPYLCGDIACLASNLSERRRLIETAAAQSCSPTSAVELSPFDVWNINKLAGKLAVNVLKESYQEGELATSAVQDLRQLLAEFKQLEQVLPSLDEAQQALLLRPHSHWLATYNAALATMDASDVEFSTCRWRDPEIYYGGFAKVCEPFLRLLHRTLTPRCEQTVQTKRRFQIAPGVIADIQSHLLNRFEMMLGWAIEADINVYCAQRKIIKSQSSREQYLEYFEQTFRDAACYHAFYCRFPVLARWLAEVTRFLGDVGNLLIRRLDGDMTEIEAAFFGGQKVREVKSFKLGMSDAHAGGSSVVVVGLALEGLKEAAVVYKPRCMKSEIAMQGLLAHLSRASVVEFATYRILARDGYGYAECIPHGQNHVESQDQVDVIYRQLGGYLGLFYVLGGGDLHFENILVANGNAFICDCETVLGVHPEGSDRLPGELFDSVYKTAMLEWPRAVPAGQEQDFKVSGYTGGESYRLPYAVPKLNNRRMSLEVAVEYVEGIQVEPDATNRVYLDGRLVNPVDRKDAIVEGFNRTYDWFRERPTEAIELVRRLFAGTLVRFINWGTQTYSHLLIASRHPKCLSEPLEVDLVFSTLWQHRRKWDGGALAEAELASLWQLDIPLFTAEAAGTELFYNYQQRLPVRLALSALDNAADRIRILSTDNRERQNRYIRASLSTGEIGSPDFVASAVDYSCQFGARICELLQPASATAPWTSFEFTSRGIRQIDIRPDLYDGTAGICLFLAYLDSVRPDLNFRKAADRALADAIARRNDAMVGAFMGTSGLIYLLVHLYHLWGDSGLLDHAVSLSHDLLPAIDQDPYFDVLNGAAGVIPVMLALADAAAGEGLDCAERCARHLLRHAVREGASLSWPPFRAEEARANLTGFAHGAAGMGWALIALGARTGREEYIQAGREAFAYESRHFDEVEGDWYDLRRSVGVAESNRPHFSNAWCNGAAGIGLSRISSWATLGRNDPGCLRDANIALKATLRNFHKLNNDSLCHGRTGNAEFLLRYARIKGELSLQMEAEVQAQGLWRDYEKNGMLACGSTSPEVFPGLMIGLAGFGMHFLHIADPVRIPSPLLLDPPAAPNHPPFSNDDDLPAGQQVPRPVFGDHE